MYRYSVIIADDEIANTRGVSQLLDTMCPQVRVVATYDNGKSVIEHLEKELVDIVIMDIRMPEATGVEVATWIFEKKLDISVVLMTGYREFEYAKQAINVGVEAFWEKPINLKAAVEKINTICQEREGEVLEQIRLSHNIVLQNERLNQDLKLYCFGISDFSTLRDKYSNKQWLYNSCAIVEFKLDEAIVYDEAYWKGIAQIEEAQFSSFLLIAEENSAKFLVVSDEKDITALANEYAEKIQKLFSLPGSNINCDFSIEHYESLRGISLQKQREIALLMLDELLFTKQKKNDILQILVHYSPNMIKDFIDVFLQCVKEKSNLPTEEYELKKADVKTKNDLMQFIDEIETDLLQNLDIKNDAIDEMEQYIKENCQNDISLRELADKFNFNYSYLSRFFKKHIKMNFSDYLMYLRIEKAKTYLSSGKYKTEEVAQLVGYNKVSYFREVFKKQTGMTASQYIMLKKIVKDEV